MHETPKPADAGAPPSRRWIMLGLVWLLYFSFGITTGTIPPLVDPIVDDLKMSYGQMGLVLGAWQLVYIGTASPMGAIVDRLGIRKSLGIGILVVWLSLVLRSLAFDFYSLFLSVALFGIGGPIVSIGAPKMVAVWFRGGERGTAAGIYATAPALGGVFALATAASVVVPLTGSWRGMSLFYGGIVLAIAVAWWIFAEDAPVDEAAERVERESSTMEVFRELLRIRNVRIMLIFAALTFFLNHGLSNWLPTLLQESGMTISQAGAWAAVARVIGIVSVLVVPRFAGIGRRALVLEVLLVLSIVSTVGLGLFTGTLLLMAVALSTVARSPMMPIMTLAMMETRGVGSVRIGSAAGLLFASAEIGGFSGPLVMGLMRDGTGSLVAPLYLLAGLVAVLLVVVPFLREGRETVTG